MSTVLHSYGVNSQRIAAVMGLRYVPLINPACFSINLPTGVCMFVTRVVFLPAFLNADQRAKLLFSGAFVWVLAGVALVVGGV